MSAVRLNAASIGGIISTQFSGLVAVPSDGIITVDSRDAPGLLASGATYINARTAAINLGVPVAASLGQIVASTTLANGTLSIAHQPDVPRQCAVRAFPGTSAITAGNVALTYVANDGTTVTDNVSMITTASAIVSQNTSKGVLKVNSVVVTALAGGASPVVQVNDTNSLSMAVDPGFTDFVLNKLMLDSADLGWSSVASSAASFTPSTAPNGTHTFSAIASFNMPNT